jgi:hypothetical protein
MSIRLGESARLRVGDTGRTLTAMTPQGKIAIAGWIYDARSDGFWIDPNAHVVVVRGDHLGVVVRQIEAADAPRLAARGRPVSQASWQCRRAPTCSNRAVHAGSDTPPSPRFWSGLRESTSLGALFGLVSVYLGFARAEMNGMLVSWLWTASAGLCGALWGALLFLGIHALLRDLGEFERLALVTLGLALLGSTGGTVTGYSVLGLIGGLTGAVLGAFCLGVLLPFLLVAAQAMAGPTEESGS